MKESEFRNDLAPLMHSKAIEFAVALSKEAGATFEPEMYRLPVLTRGNSSVHPSLIVRFDGQHLSYEEVDEVLRRCKAVEEAAEYVRDLARCGEVNVSRVSYGDLAQNLLAILEGTK